MVSVSARFGIELLTGYVDRLLEREEGHHGEDEEHREDVSSKILQHTHGLGAVHNHDVAVGSGSFDYIVGLRILSSLRQASFNIDASYKITTEGDFEYEYGNSVNYRAAAAYSIVSNKSSDFILRGGLDKS